MRHGIGTIGASLMLTLLPACGGFTPAATVAPGSPPIPASEPALAPSAAPATASNDGTPLARSDQPAPEVAATASVTPALGSVEDATYSRRTPFVPLDVPALVTVEEGAYLPHDDLVLGLEWMGEARAYPIRMLTHHHIVNDTVAGRPLLITY